MASEQSADHRFKKPLKQWIKAFFWCLIYILFIVWVDSYWWMLLLPLVFDGFITQYIPWTWWKKTKNKALLSFFSWVDAIGFALVAVYFINNFLFQNYQIPSSSLEKSLLVGDFLLVSKASYGPRIPNTPLSFPLVQHTFPLLNTKSYIEHPHWEYRRMKGFDTIKHNDIVVFNFPAGDTVAVNMPNPDYYWLCRYYGRDAVNSNKAQYGDIVYRPVDRRENFVKRCVGLPGDWLTIKDNQLYINGKAQEKFPGIQFNYFIQTDGTLIPEDVLSDLNISNEDLKNGFFDNSNENTKANIAYFGFDPAKPLYLLPLTEEAFSKVKQLPYVKSLKIEPSFMGGDVYPLGWVKHWNRDNFGPLWIPKKGAKLLLTSANLPIYERVIKNYENNKLEVKDGVIYINDQPAKTYTFKMDYYWMMGDNRHNSADSRSWGFVPEDHIVGRPVFVWLSLDKDKGLFNGKIRWNRFFKSAER